MPLEMTGGLLLREDVDLVVQAHAVVAADKYRDSSASPLRFNSGSDSVRIMEVDAACKICQCCQRMCAASSGVKASAMKGTIRESAILHYDRSAASTPDAPAIASVMRSHWANGGYPDRARAAEQG